ncbi:phosphatidylinositol-specific phospholipase C domain-containing protein [Enterococcus sp. DIV0660C]|uniref:phosphatidylinositol-specific phospholipase C domain-containing protein n=1 Tax=Enterococcus sp. DIV0660C TaxID=2230880 RepID=UPI001A8CAE1F|nr:phosphatidylinositol-specific phospholipase C domain-containing protein [Enterococcus sp. DIV0660C]MBO0432149.1 phosphatidylinositol-specific phospholipase C domain-containing protein [Enterococcus sp. DIV0660C]
MEKKIWGWLLVGVIFLGCVLPAVKVDADMFDYYWEGRARNQTWMSDLKDNTRLSELSIPGTHDSASHGIKNSTGLGYAKTQSIDITRQLNNGIRFLDARVCETNGSFAMHHGVYYLNSMFGDVLNSVTSFLRKNPGEVVYMRLKQENSSVSDQVFNQVLNEKYLKNSCWKDFFYYGRSNPTLGETRGKIVILRNFLGNSVGIPYPSQFDIQDYWDPADPADKRWAIEQQLAKAAKSQGTDNIKYINYLSASNFFYQIKGFAEKMNPFTVNYIRNNQVKHVGIVAADYPGSELVNTIIDLNNRLLKNPEKHGEYSSSIVTIQTLLDTNKVIDWYKSFNSGIIYPNNNGSNQKWQMWYDSNAKAYRIHTYDYGHLALRQATTPYNTSRYNVVIEGADDSNRGLWQLIPAGEHGKNKVYYLKNCASNLYLDVKSSVHDPSGELITFPYTGETNQKFVINVIR